MSTSSPFAQRLETLRARIALACEQAGRSPDAVTLLPVSKTFPVPVVEQALACGLRRFGENKMQDIRDKSQALAQHELQWVMIGHLQTNKAKDAARYASEVQSLDRLSLAQALQQRLVLEERHLDVLIQVKTSPEPSKFGLAPEAVSEFMAQLTDFPNIQVRGLMTMAENHPDPERVKACFRRLRELRDRLQDQGYSQVQRLSMGMSTDMELAIAEGATELRIGSALFGERSYA